MSKLVSQHHVVFQVPLQGSRRRRQPEALNMNQYANKKSVAESMLDVALLMANASQLKAVLEQGPDFTFYSVLITLISISLILQVIVGIMLIFICESPVLLFSCFLMLYDLSDSLLHPRVIYVSFLNVGISLPQEAVRHVMTSLLRSAGS